MGYDNTQSTTLPRQRPQQDFQRSYTPMSRMDSDMSLSSRRAPKPEIQSFEMQTRTTAMPEPFEHQQQPPPRSASAASGGYVAFNPSFTLAAAAPSFTPPDRSTTSPPEIARPSVAAGPQRSATVPPEAYDGLIDEYRGQPQYNRREMPGRSATATSSQRSAPPSRSASTAPYQPYGAPSRSASTAPLQPLYEVPTRSATALPTQRHAVPARSATAAPLRPYEVPGRSASAAPGQQYRTQEW